MMNQSCTLIMSIRPTILVQVPRSSFRKFTGVIPQFSHVANNNNNKRKMNMGGVRNNSSNNNNNNNNGHNSSKSLNWLIRPHREKTDAGPSRIDMGVLGRKEESSDAKVAINNGLGSAATITTTKSKTPESIVEPPPQKGTYYHEKVILGYSAEQMCDLVGNVQKYKEFLPFCINSEIVLDENMYKNKRQGYL